MKKLLSILFLILLYSGASAQRAYNPLSMFGTDTLRYLTNNFVSNQSRYIGKRFERVVTDYELPVKNFIVYSSDYSDNAIVDGAIIMYLDMDVARKIRTSGGTYYSLYVEFSSPVADYDRLTDILDNFDTYREEAMYMKDFIVKSISIYTHPTPPREPPIFGVHYTKKNGEQIVIQQKGRAFTEEEKAAVLAKLAAEDNSDTDTDSAPDPGGSDPH